MEALAVTTAQNYENLSLMKKLALSLLDTMYQNIKDKIISNECSDEELTEALVKFHPESHKYFKQEDFVTADKAMEILHLGFNRGKFFALTKEYGIKNHKISNQNIGFLRKDIERLAEIQSEEVKAREKKQLRKQGQRKFLW